MILNLDNNLMDIYLAISQQLRQAGINVITGFEQRPIGKQFQQADKQGIPLCLLIGSNEYSEKKARIKNLKTGEQVDIAWENLIQEVKARL